MAKVVITFEDTGRETVTVNIAFDPPLDNVGDTVCTPAQQSAFKLWQLANEEKARRDDDEDEDECDE